MQTMIQFPICLALALYLSVNVSAVLQPSGATNDDCGRFLGRSEDGVSYFLTSQARYTWNQARDHCKNCGLEFATIRSKAQSDYLYAALANFTDAGSDGVAWIAARENRKHLEYLAWDADSSDIEDGVFNVLMDALVDVDYFVCAQFEAKYNYGEAWIVLTLCSVNNHVLCMAPSNQDNSM